MPRGLDDEHEEFHGVRDVDTLGVETERIFELNNTEARHEGEGRGRGDKGGREQERASERARLE
jgi:hypothetical protein